MSTEKIALARLPDACPIHGRETVIQSDTESIIGGSLVSRKVQHSCAVGDCGEFLGWELHKSDRVFRSGPGECRDPMLEQSRREAREFSYILPPVLLTALLGVAGVFACIWATDLWLEGEWWAVVAGTMGGMTIVAGLLFVVGWASTKLYRRKHGDPLQPVTP